MTKLNKEFFRPLTKRQATNRRKKRLIHFIIVGNEYKVWKPRKGTPPMAKLTYREQIETLRFINEENRKAHRPIIKESIPAPNFNQFEGKARAVWGKVVAELPPTEPDPDPEEKINFKKIVKPGLTGKVPESKVVSRSGISSGRTTRKGTPTMAKNKTATVTAAEPRNFQEAKAATPAPVVDPVPIPEAPATLPGMEGATPAPASSDFKHKKHCPDCKHNVQSHAPGSVKCPKCAALLSKDFNPAYTTTVRTTPGASKTPSKPRTDENGNKIRNKRTPPGPDFKTLQNDIPALAAFLNTIGEEAVQAALAYGAEEREDERIRQQAEAEIAKRKAERLAKAGTLLNRLAPTNGNAPTLNLNPTNGTTH